MSLKIISVCVVLTAATACAAKAPPSASDSESRVPIGRNRDLITQADLASDPTMRANSVLEVVRALRPHFLTVRGTQTIRDERAGGVGDPEAGLVHVSIDNGRILPLSELSGMHASEAIEIRYLNVAQAMQKFGTAARQGPVILVITAKPTNRSS